MSLGDLLMHFCACSDLTQEEAAIDEKSLLVESKKATLEEEAEMGTCVFCMYCCHNF